MKFNQMVKKSNFDETKNTCDETQNSNRDKNSNGDEH